MALDDIDRIDYWCVLTGNDDWWQDVVLDLIGDDVLSFDDACRLINSGGTE